MLDFNVVKKTKLRQKGELDRLFGVSRIMVNRYLSGESLPRGANRKHISKTIDVMAELLEAGTLPIDEKTDENVRAQILAEISNQATS
jgi:predicted transcriptional regulator